MLQQVVCSIKMPLALLADSLEEKHLEAKTVVVAQWGNIRACRLGGRMGYIRNRSTATGSKHHKS